MKTKAGTNRTVPIHPRIRPLVIKWYNKAQELNSEYLFNCTDTNTARSNLMLTYDKYRRRIEALVDALELNPDHRPHDGRNTFITMCKNAGVDEYAIKTMVGHEIYDITENTVVFLIASVSVGCISNVSVVYQLPTFTHFLLLSTAFTNPYFTRFLRICQLCELPRCLQQQRLSFRPSGCYQHR